MDKIENTLEQNAPDVITQTAIDFFHIPAPLPYQRLVINSTLCASGYYGSEIESEEPKERIIILPTGAGKSLCFMLPPILVSGIVIVIFPLLSLIADQKRRCEEAKINCWVLKGGLSKEEKSTLFENIKKSESGILLTNIESLVVESNIKELSKLSILQLVFDEAHTLFEWGDNFRPTLLKATEVIKNLQPKIVDAFTATASTSGIARIKEILFPESTPVVINANPDRENISYHILPTLSKSKSLQEIFSPTSNLDPKIERPAILFFRNRLEVSKTAAKLRKLYPEIQIFSYHAGLSKEEKEKIEKEFFASSDGILCSTNAYGMGVDKSNIRTVIHMQIPPTVESYLQESGRGGRDKKQAYAWILLSPSDLFEYKKKKIVFKQLNASLLDIVFDNKNCRREKLLKVMGHENVVCTSCDVCSGNVLKSGIECEEISKKLKRANKFYSLEEIKKILRGKKISFFASALNRKLKNYSALEIDEVTKELKILSDSMKLKKSDIF